MSLILTSDGVDAGHEGIGRQCVAVGNKGEEVWDRRVGQGSTQRR